VIARIVRPATALLRRFLVANQRLSAALGRRLPPHDALVRRYDQVVAEHARRAPTPVVVDVGGGRTCSFCPLLSGEDGIRVVAVDVSEAELSHNSDVADRRVADVAHELPFADAEVGVIASRTVLEHVPDVDAFVRHSSRVLAPGGYAVHFVPCRNALFALGARAIPFELAKAILHFVKPESVGVVEFPVYYDRCTPAEMEASMRRHGFQDVRIEVTYSQTDYFDAFFPAFVACAAYEKLVERLGLRNLAAYMLVVGRR
jgi:ubiquinone/menaquinone biosynthesis C-methylase UbiE